MQKYILNIIVFFIAVNIQILNAQNYGSISGNITGGKSDLVLEGVQVYLMEQSIGTVSDEAGLYSIEKIPPGKYTVVASMIGYTSIKRENILVEDGKTTRVDFGLVSTIYESQEVVVSASKMNSLIEDIPSAVYVIDKRELEISESRNIEEVLNRVAGVFTEDRRHRESNIISFRGIGLHSHVTRSILILVDGISINEAMGRAVFEGIDLETAERVEVLKGPVSALYGPNGITGVINVVTKEPSGEFQSSFNASYGSYDTRKLSADVSGRIGRLNFSLSGSRYLSEGYLNRTDYSSDKIGVKLNMHADDLGKFGLSMNYIVADSKNGGTLDSAQFANRSTVATSKYTGSLKDLIRGTLTHQKFWTANTSINTNIYFRSRYDEGHYLDERFGIDDIQLFGGETRFQTGFNLFGRESKIIAGVNLEQESGTSKVYNRDENGIVQNLRGDGESIYNMLGVYLQNEYDILDDLKITAGVRYDLIQYDWNDLFLSDGDNSGNNSISSISPKLGFTFNYWDNISIYGNIGRGFNPPQISQLFIGSSYSGLPNKDLKPEYLTNYELGVRGKFLEVLDFQVSLFNMEFQDQIVADGDPPVYENIGNTRHSGVETTLNMNAFRNLNIYLTYSYTDARYVDHPDYGNNYLRRAPKNQVGAGLRYMHPIGITASLDYKMVGEYFMDNEEHSIYEGYSIVNAKLIYKWRKYYTSIRVNNLLDTHYATRAYARSSYDRSARATVWSYSYYPGWPRNFTFTLGLSI